MLTPTLAILLVLFHASLQICHHTAMTFYQQVSDDLWAMQKLRESVFIALRDSNPHTHSLQSYSAVMVLMDGLRRRTVDLYPVLDDLPTLRPESPANQLESILEIFSQQRHVGCAAELVNKAVNTGKLKVEKNLTRGLDLINPQSRAICLNEILDIFWAYLCTCPPTQPLVGGLLINVPVRMSVSNTRQEVSNMLRDNSFASEDWTDVLEEVDPRNQTLTQWLAEVLVVLANQTDAPERLESLSDGIIQISPVSADADEKPEEEIGYRIHPKELDAAGYFVPPTREERGIYKVGPRPQFSNHAEHYKAKIPLPRPKRHIDTVTEKLKKLEHTVSP